MAKLTRLDRSKIDAIRPITIWYSAVDRVYTVNTADGETLYSADHALVAGLIATHDMVLATDRPRFVLAATVDGEQGYDWVEPNTTIDPCDQIAAWWKI